MDQMRAPSPRLVPRVPLQLGEQTYQLVLDFNALDLIEQRTGHRALAQLPLDTLSAGQLRTVIWAALRAEAPEVTEQQIGGLLWYGNLPYVLGQLGTLLTLAFPPDAAQAAQEVSDEHPPLPLAAGAPTG